MTEASALSLEYVDLVPGLRQTMGLFTTGMQTQNNASDIKIFMKDIGVSGYIFSSPLIFSTQ